MSADPIGQWNHTNVYQYGYNNPTNFIDPRGEFGWILLRHPAVAAAVATTVTAGASIACGNNPDCVAAVEGAANRIGDALAAAGQACMNAISGEDDDADDLFAPETPGIEDPTAPDEFPDLDRPTPPIHAPDEPPPQTSDAGRPTPEQPQLPQPDGAEEITLGMIVADVWHAAKKKMVGILRRFF